MPRRGESVYKRKDGRWEARYIHHYENGKAKYRYLYAPTYAEVKAKRTQELRNKNGIVFSKIKYTAVFSDLAETWLTDIKFSVKESSFTRYYRIVHTYLNPRIGDIMLSKLSVSSLKLLIASLLTGGGKNGKPLSSKTVSDMVSVLKSIYKYGAELGYPCMDISCITTTQRPKKPVSILSQDSLHILLKKLLSSEDRVSLGILFALYTGIRLGELCGLRHGDINMKNKTVEISRTIERISNLSREDGNKTKVIITDPKTESSHRVIPLPSFLMEYLKKFKADPSCYLLTGSEKNTEPHQFYLRYKTFLKRNQIEDYTFHALRHTFATNCIKQGFDAKSLSEILGHSNISTTLAIYVHPTIEQKRELMEKLTPKF